MVNRNFPLAFETNGVYYNTHTHTLMEIHNGT